MDISPTYLMDLIQQMEEVIWKKFASYKNVNFFIRKWQYHDEFGNLNFDIYYENSNISLKETLHNVDNETLIKIAIDIGIETPDFIPSVPVIVNELKQNHSNSHSQFKKAIEQVRSGPDIAVGLANSALEGIVKHILQDTRITTKWGKHDTLYKLTGSLLTEFQLYPKSAMPIEIKYIGSSLLNASKNIEEIRSNKTSFHGKSAEDYLIKDELYAYFIINSVTTIGLFLIDFYKKKFPAKATLKKSADVNQEDIPF